MTRRVDVARSRAPRTGQQRPAQHRKPRSLTVPAPASLARLGLAAALTTSLVAASQLPAGATAPSDTSAKAAGEAASAAAAKSVDLSAASAVGAFASGGALSAAVGSTVAFERGAVTVTVTPKPKPKPKVVKKVVKKATKKATTTKKARTAKKRAVATRSRTHTARVAKKASRSSARVVRSSVSTGGVLRIAASLSGIPYRYGGTTTAGFDCSGFTKYVFAKVGKSLPRTSGAQYAASRKISRSAARPGDLVFFLSGGRVYHVGIYAGGNKMYDSPRTGKSTGLRSIWSSNIAFGRV